ncbi:MAG: hypothetical protein ACTSRZ_00045 [Promethearchaeota archaeon]
MPKKSRKSHKGKKTKTRKKKTFPKSYKFLLTKYFGDTYRVRVMEFLLYILKNWDSTLFESPKTYISQISKLTKLSKSSVKKAIDELIQENVLIENKEETHAKYPRRFVYLDKNNPITMELFEFYKKIS